MRPRWIVALLCLSFPLWIVPGLFYVGWKEAGVDTFKQMPAAFRYALWGIEP